MSYIIELLVLNMKEHSFYISIVTHAFLHPYYIPNISPDKGIRDGDLFEPSQIVGDHIKDSLSF